MNGKDLDGCSRRVTEVLIVSVNFLIRSVKKRVNLSEASRAVLQHVGAEHFPNTPGGSQLRKHS
jgi:hypothetical protein